LACTLFSKENLHPNSTKQILYFRPADQKGTNISQERHLLFEFILTINAPLILKMRDIIFFFFAGNYIMGHFKGYFEGAKTFLTPKLSLESTRYLRKVSLLLSLSPT
jgi:hypothetical protein